MGFFIGFFVCLAVFSFVQLFLLMGSCMEVLYMFKKSRGSSMVAADSIGLCRTYALPSTVLR